MTDATKLIAGLLLIALTTIEFGGSFLLRILSGKHSRPDGLIGLVCIGVFVLGGSLTMRGNGLIRVGG
jgi:hypothetical protein